MATIDWSALHSRTTFVVGKGGVGKSTTAAAIATHFARSNSSTHIISTDPAHSLSDVFGGAPPAGLTVEEFDASGYADAWLEAARAALLQIVERGTYLDAADAASLLDLSLPGVDEVMAAFRLVELEQGAAQRIVVDTAPTGHTLRLLDAARVVDSWADALEAIVAKADAVSLGLVGRSPDWPAGALIRDWRDRAAAFRRLIAAAQFVIVTRAGPVVQAETARLRAALETRRLAVAGMAAVGPGVPAADWTLDLNAAEVRAGPERKGGAVQWFGQRPEAILLCAGKGGVGKSTCAAAIALARADARGVCLVSTDPAGSLADVLERPITAQAQEIAPNLRAWQLDAVSRYAALREQYAADVKRVFEQLGLDQAIALDRKVIERLWNLAPPGIDEIVALTEVMNATERCTALVLDTAPTGHFLRLLAMPDLAVQWSHALMRLLLKYRVAGSLESFSQEVLGFARQARQLGAELTTPGQAGAVLVTLDQPVVWAETERLHAALVTAQIPVIALIINRADVDGPLRGQPDFLHSSTLIRAPNLPSPPMGSESLRDFMNRWEFLH